MNLRPMLLLSLAVALLIVPATVSAHCDGMDGPVVKAAREALKTGAVNLVLVWVRPHDEAEIREAFRKTLEVRKLNPASRDLADRYFFETLVRIHRAGEGAPYTGLKPAGRDLGPAIPAADRAVDSGSAGAVLQLLTHAVRDGVQDRFGRVLAAKEFAADDVEAGRRYVDAYVEFLHYVEGIFEAAQATRQTHAEH